MMEEKEESSVSGVEDKRLVVRYFLLTFTKFCLKKKKKKKKKKKIT